MTSLQDASADQCTPLWVREQGRSRYVGPGLTTGASLTILPLRDGALIAYTSAPFAHSSSHSALLKIGFVLDPIVDFLRTLPVTRIEADRTCIPTETAYHASGHLYLRGRIAAIDEAAWGALIVALDRATPALRERIAAISSTDVDEGLLSTGYHAV